VTLRDYVSVVRRRLPVVALTIAVTVTTAFALTMSVEDEYRASAVLRLDAKAVTEDNVRVDASFIERLANTYAQIANSDPVAGEAGREVGLGTQPAVDVDPVPNTELLNVAVDARTPQSAARLANEVSGNLIARVRELNQARARRVGERFDTRIGQLVTEIATAQKRYLDLQATGVGGARTENRLLELETTIRSRQDALDALGAEKQREQLAADRADFALAVVDPARPPESASGPGLALNLALGLVLGILCGIALAFVFENLNPTVHTTEEIAVAASELPANDDSVILGRIPKHALREPIVGAGDRSFHELRMAVFGENGRAAIRSLLVTSVRPNEGKSAVVVNLGASLARSGRRVVVVDADLREPTLHLRLGVPNNLGLTSVLRGLVDLDECVRPADVAGLAVLTSGTRVDDPTGLLINGNLAAVTEGLHALGFDTVLVDGPPVLGAPDSLVLARAVDASMLVVHPTGMQRASLQTAVTELRRLDSPLLGVVVTDARDVWTAAPRTDDVPEESPEVLITDPRVRVDFVVTEAPPPLPEPEAPVVAPVVQPKAPEAPAGRWSPPPELLETAEGGQG
jgi:capsular exopolysaccharide synthesis family protein